MSADAVGYVLSLLILGLSMIAAKSSYYILKFMAGVAWLAMAIYWISDTPSSIVQGSVTDKVVIIFLIFMGVAFILMPFWYPKRQNGDEVGGRLRLPFMPTDEEEEESTRDLPTRSDRNRSYQDRVNSALRGETRRR